MHLRNYHVEKSRSLGATKGTYTMDLPATGFLTALAVRMTGTNAAAADCDGLHPHDVMTEIRVESAEHGIMKLYRGIEAKALQFYSGMLQGIDYLSDHETMIQEETIWVLFGQHLGDPEFGVNLAALTNPQLKVTWDDTQTSYDGLTCVAWHATTHPALTVIAYMLEDFGGFPKGFIKSQQIYTYAPANNATEYVELPIGEPYRRIMLRQYYTEKQLTDWLANLKLNIESGAKTPWDIRGHDLMQLNAQLYGTFPFRQRITIVSEESRDSHLEHYLSGTAMSRYLPEVGAHRIVSYLGGRLRLAQITYSTGLAYDSENTYQVWVEGYGPMHAIMLPFDKPGSIEDALVTSGLGEMQLEITAGASAPTSGTVYVVLETIKV